MAYLIDTSILARLANSADTFHPVAAHAVLALHRRGEVLHVTPQNLVEFRNVATRSVALRNRKEITCPSGCLIPREDSKVNEQVVYVGFLNGLGLAPPEAEAKAAGFEAAFPLLAETPDIFSLWKALVGSLAVVGKQVHDARLVAVCHAYQITHLLTFNVPHFTRLVSFGAGITMVDPATV